MTAKRTQGYFSIPQVYCGDSKEWITHGNVVKMPSTTGNVGVTFTIDKTITITANEAGEVHVLGAEKWGQREFEERHVKEKKLVVSKTLSEYSNCELTFKGRNSYGAKYSRDHILRPLNTEEPVYMTFDHQTNTITTLTMVEVNNVLYTTTPEMSCVYKEIQFVIQDDEKNDENIQWKKIRVNGGCLYLDASNLVLEVLSAVNSGCCIIGATQESGRLLMAGNYGRIRSLSRTVLKPHMIDAHDNGQIHLTEIREANKDAICNIEAHSSAQIKIERADAVSLTACDFSSVSVAGKACYNKNSRNHAKITFVHFDA